MASGGMDWEGDLRAKGVWCLIARVSAKAPGQNEKRLGYDQFQAGTQVYCIPPNRNDDDAEVKVVGYGKRFHRLVSTTLYAKHLKHWNAEYVTDPKLLKVLSPPWDSKDDSQMLAFMVAQAREGGPWPAIELRDWNRTRAQKSRGGPGWLAQLRNSITEMLGMGKKKKKRKSKSK
jgi:hypothetical protein